MEHYPTWAEIAIWTLVAGAVLVAMIVDSRRTVHKRARWKLRDEMALAEGEIVRLKADLNKARDRGDWHKANVARAVGKLHEAQNEADDLVRMIHGLDDHLPKPHPDDEAATIDAAVARIEAIGTALALVQRTADGAPITIKTELWRRAFREIEEHDGSIFEQPAERHYANLHPYLIITGSPRGYIGPLDARDFYSSQGAAEAAGVDDRTGDQAGADAEEGTTETRETASGYPSAAETDSDDGTQETACGLASRCRSDRPADLAPTTADADGGS